MLNKVLGWILAIVLLVGIGYLTFKFIKWILAFSVIYAVIKVCIEKE